MRSDGRKTDKLRRIEVIPALSAFAEGSALSSIGETRVLCNVTVFARQTTGSGFQWHTGTTRLASLNPERLKVHRFIP
jgi:ribonuclease PH